MQPEREHDRKRDLVQLHAGPVRGPVDPEILRKAAVGLLRAGEINQRPHSGGVISGGHQTGHAIDQVAGPYQVITAQLFIALDFTPWDAERSDHSARIALVLVREEQFTAAAIKGATVAGERPKWEEMGRGATPLIEESSAALLERRAERLKQGRGCAMQRAPES